MRKRDIAKKLGVVVLALVLGISGGVPAVSAAYAQPAAEDAVQDDGKDDSSRSDTDVQDGLQITMQTYQYDFQTKDGKVYKKISFQYPNAEGDSEAAKALNQFYQRLFAKWKKEAKKNLQEAKEIVSQFEDEESDIERCYTDEVTCEIMYQDENYISILQTGYDYQMGAHGMPYRYAYIFDVKTGQKVSAAKILGLTKKELNEKVRRLYLKKYDKEPETFFGERSAIQKALESIDFNQNMYYIRNGKIRFFVYPYAIAPYAAGFVETAVKM